MKHMIHVCVVPHDDPACRTSVSVYLFDHDCLDRIAGLVRQMRAGYSLGVYLHSESFTTTTRGWEFTSPLPMKRVRSGRKAA